MEKVILGKTGLEVSVAGLGCGGHSRLGMFSKGMENACGIIRCAYENGVSFFDTATTYGTQPASMACPDRRAARPLRVVNKVSIPKRRGHATC